MTSFDNKKQLKFIIKLGTKTFGSNKEDKISMVGFRAIAEVNKIGGVYNNTLRARIYGVKKEYMDQITTLQWSADSGLIRNTVEVYAIDGKSESLVFAGDIINAFGDYQSMPDVFLHIQGSANYGAQLEAANPLSINGVANVEVLMAKIANLLKKEFVSEKINTVLVDMYADGDIISQARAICEAANVDLVIDDKTVTIKNRNQSITGGEPIISKETGLIGYPTFDGTGVAFRCLYNPAIRFGGAVVLDTSLARAKGRWIVDSVNLHLESEKPGGAWFSYVYGSLHGQALK